MGGIWVFLGSVSGFIAVAAGAMGAHELKSRLEPDLFQHFETAARYQIYHALALLAVGLWSSRATSMAARLAGFAFGIGTLLFSGSLYALALSGERWLGAVTPWGGLAFLLGWAALAVAALRRVP
jgi:uncharacterized membrane protein YgdD (TMEM256/DUF423 family)